MTAVAEIPSYAQGFAPRDGPPQYPSLWTGLMGLWVPWLGASGTLLRDCGRGNHATMVAPDWSASPYGDCWTSDNPTYASAPDLARYDVSPQVSLAVWCKPTTINQYMHVGGRWSSYALLCRTQNSDGFRFNAWQGGTVKAASQGSVPSTGRWYFVVGVANGSNVLLYLDGQLATTGDACVSLAASASAMFMGGYEGDPTSSTYAFQGDIGLWAAWDRALTDSEILHLYRDPPAILRLRRRVFPAVTAAADAMPMAMDHYRRRRVA